MLVLSAVKGSTLACESVAHRGDEQQSEAQARQPQVTDGGVLELARALGSGLEGDGGAADLAGECTPAGLQTRGMRLVKPQTGILAGLACCSVHAQQRDRATQHFSRHLVHDSMLLRAWPSRPEDQKRLPIC